MMIIDRLLVGGIRFVLDKVARAVDAELPGDEAEGLRRERLDAQMRLELGELDEDAYMETEGMIVKRIEELRRAAAPGRRKRRRAEGR